MALTDVVHRKCKAEKENKKDFYQTPHCLTEAFIGGLKDIDIVDFKSTRVLDPCSGEGAITKILKKYFKNIITNDLFYCGWDFNEDFLQMKNIEADLCLFNPPYSQKNEFIDKALEISRIVAVILPSNVENYTIMNKKYFSQEFYLGAIRTFPKFFMDQSLNKIKFGGMSTYVVYIFSKDVDLQKEFPHRFDVRKDIRDYLDVGK